MKIKLSKLCQTVADAGVWELHPHEYDWMFLEEVQANKISQLCTAMGTSFQFINEVIPIQ